MLVLKRKVGESIHLLIEGTEIAEIRLGDIVGRAASIMIEAAPQIKILRAELLKTEKREETHAGN